MKLMRPLALLAFLSACQAVPAPEQVGAAATLGQAHFESTASLRDDSLDLIATITTADGYRPRRGAFDKSWNDNFLRAFVDKRTGRTTYQVYQDFFYRAHAMRRYYAANYAGLGGPRSVDVTVIDRDIVCTGSILSPCSYFETVGFEVDEEVLRAAAGGAQSGGAPWRFKFRARSGADFHTGLAPAEVAGLLARVDQYRARRGLQ